MSRIIGLTVSIRVNYDDGMETQEFLGMGYQESNAAFVTRVIEALSKLLGMSKGGEGNVAMW